MIGYAAQYRKKMKCFMVQWPVLGVIALWVYRVSRFRHTFLFFWLKYSLSYNIFIQTTQCLFVGPLGNTNSHLPREYSTSRYTIIGQRHRRGAFPGIYRWPQHHQKEPEIYVTGLAFVCSISYNWPWLARSCLTVSKQGRVEPFPRVVQDALTNVVEHLFLLKYD